MKISELLTRFEKYRQSGSGYQVRCPAHNDNVASLNIREGEKGLLFYCHAGCTVRSVLDALQLSHDDIFYETRPNQARPTSNGKSSNGVAAAPAPAPLRLAAPAPADRAAEPQRILCTYDYRDETGQLLYQVVRFEPKDFRQRRPDPAAPGRWIWKLEHVRRVLYRLPELLAAHPDATIWIVEGEKDADALAAQCCIATSSVGGAGKWKPEYAESLRDREVVIIPDNDEPGRDHAEAVRQSLQSIARSVHILHLPGLPLKGDVSDWLAIDGNDAERLAIIAEESVAQHKAAVLLKDSKPAVIISDPATWRRTQEGLARELVKRTSGNLRFISDLASDLRSETWAWWGGQRWFFRVPAIAALTEEQRLMTEEFREWINRLLEKCGGEVESLSKAEMAAQRFSKEMESSGFKAGWRAEVKGFSSIYVQIGQFDSDRLLLNCANGTLDLRTGMLQSFNRENYLSRQLTNFYDPNEQCPRWLAFLDTIFDGNQPMIDYLQRAVGYTLTGDTSEQCFFLCHGPGANGKSVFLDVITALLGEFAQSSLMTTFTAKPNDSGSSNDLARMRGARLVTASETNDGMRLDEALVKKITGQDMITARFLYGEYFDFLPQFKLWLAMNHLPTIRGTDDGIWRRVRLIPFRVIIPEVQRDKHLSARLQQELPGILAWAVRGCLDWQQNGMRTPKEVITATDSYRSDQDVLGTFIDECCVTGTAYQVLFADLYAAYKRWAESTGEYVVSQRKFGTRLSDRGFSFEHSRQGSKRLGIGLRQDF
jgi:putative DNA primase/helicase